MPIRNAIWTVSAQPQPLREGRLPSEKALEDMIVAAPRMITPVVATRIAPRS